jgi:hypothetical protein
VVKNETEAGVIMTNSTIPKLDKPGAGLPFPEWAVANYILVPLRMRTVSVAKALDEFKQETAKIEKMASTLSVEQLSEKRLIARLTGLEDSSRYWSVAMALEHLMIVNTRGMKLAKSLAKGVMPDGKSSTADVKPDGAIDASKIVAKFLSNSELYGKTVASLKLEAHPNVKFQHPWFGMMNAKEWVLFAAPHMQIHRKQIEAIVKRL